MAFGDSVSSVYLFRPVVYPGRHWRMFVLVELVVKYLLILLFPVLCWGQVHTEITSYDTIWHEGYAKDLGIIFRGSVIEKVATFRISADGDTLLNSFREFHIRPQCFVIFVPYESLVEPKDLSTTKIIWRGQ